MERAVPPHIRQIVQSAVAAPSGDNSQPWHFVFRAPDTLEFHAHPEQDHPILNVDEGGTLIALGAAVENACLKAEALGYTSRLTLSLNGPYVVKMRLGQGGTQHPARAALTERIHDRTSNRKHYAKRPLETEDKTALLDDANTVEGVSVTLLEDPKTMQEAARSLTTMEEIALGHQVLHAHFFSSIFWSDERNEAGEPGLHIHTLELPPPAQALFRVLRHWSVARALSRIGFPRFVATVNATQNASASALGCITADVLTPETYFAAGRLLERLWLRATARGMSFQVVTGLLFMARYVEQGKGDAVFSPVEQKASLQAYAKIKDVFASGSRKPIITFRVGYGPAPTKRSRRKEPRIEVVN